MTPGRGRRTIALVTALALGCAAARPARTDLLGDPLSPELRVALAEPELELWLEGTKPIDPGEARAALAASRSALARALAGRGLEARDPDLLLVVKAREVARTSERRTAQVLSVVLVVVVVVAVVVAILTGK